MTPQRRAASASPDEIHDDESLGVKSLFNFAMLLFVNFHLVTSDSTNKNGGGPSGWDSLTNGGGEGGELASSSVNKPEKKRPGVRVQSFGM